MIKNPANFIELLEQLNLELDNLYYRKGSNAHEKAQDIENRLMAGFLEDTGTTWETYRDTQEGRHLYTDFQILSRYYNCKTETERAEKIGDFRKELQYDIISMMVARKPKPKK